MLGKVVGVLGISLLVVGCSSISKTALDADNAQLQLRSCQMRELEVSDSKVALRAVIATLQDLGFIIERADERLGLISAKSFRDYSSITVTVRKAEGRKVMVRANAQQGRSAITEPKAYQNFFNALNQSLYLELNS